jgi:hypothetical protein
MMQGKHDPQMGVTVVILLALAMLWTLAACRPQTILRNSNQERMFRDRFVNKPFYTAMIVRPYLYGDEYLIDLTGSVSEAEAQTLRAPIAVPLGTPITIVEIGERAILARVRGYAERFRILVRTANGRVEDVAKELSQLLSSSPPLDTVNPTIRPYIERQELTRGMSHREVFMSWGPPDYIHDTPGASGFWEQWIYYQRRSHLYLQNGVLTNWEQF